MRRSLCVRILFFLFVLPTCSFAQQSAARHPDSGTPPRGVDSETIVSLLQQSHELNSQFPIEAQYSLLREQTELASQVQPELGRQWANELFLLAGQMKGPARSQAQDFAMSILARADPDRALELLHALDLNDADATTSSPFPPQSALARQVFQVLVQRDGEAALPAIEREAAFIGSRGIYPYSAVGSAASAAVSKDWRENKDHAVQVEQSALDLMFARYSTTAHTYFGDVEFGEMLKVLSAGVPVESIKPALHLLVSNLLATDTSKYQYRADVYTADGQSAKADNAIDAALLWLGQVIDRDPELAQRLESTRSQLREGLEYAKVGRMRGGGFGVRVGPPKPSPVDPTREAAIDAVRLAHINPDLAITKAEALPAGPERSHTLLQVARGISSGDPDRAAQLVAEASTGSQAGDEENELDVISVKASVAFAKGNQAELKSLLQSGFERAARFISGQTRPFVDGMGGLVQLGIQNDPELTLAFFQRLPSSETKAHLLLSAAEALNIRQLSREHRLNRAPHPTPSSEMK